MRSGLRRANAPRRDRERTDRRLLAGGRGVSCLRSTSTSFLFCTSFINPSATAHSVLNTRFYSTGKWGDAELRIGFGRWQCGQCGSRGGGQCGQCGSRGGGQCGQCSVLRRRGTRGNKAGSHENRLGGRGAGKSRKPKNRRQGES